MPSQLSNNASPQNSSPNIKNELRVLAPASFSCTNQPYKCSQNNFLIWWAIGCPNQKRFPCDFATPAQMSDVAPPGHRTCEPKRGRAKPEDFGEDWLAGAQRRQVWASIPRGQCKQGPGECRCLFVCEMVAFRGGTM